MSKQEDLPSITTRKGGPGGERSSATVGDTAMIVKEVDEFLDLARIEDGVINPQDIESLIEKTSSMLVENKKDVRVKKMYTRYQNLWTEFVAKNNVLDEYNDIELVKIFKLIKPRYSPNTLWVIYSCLNARFIDLYGLNLKGLPRLHKYLKQQTQLYVAKKSKTFTAEEIDQVLLTLQAPDQPRETLQGVAIALLYYGLLRANEVRLITVFDVKLHSEPTKKEIEVTFTHPRKRKNEGFAFYVPAKFYPMFRSYIQELCEDTIEAGKTQFLKNWSRLGNRRIQNTGKNTVNGLHSVACKILRKSSSGYTSHCWRRSAATNLADAGVSLINLKRHGQWTSDKVVEGYIANSKPLRQERLNGLLPAEKKESVRQQDEENVSKAIETFDSYVDLTDTDLPLVDAPSDDAITLYGFSQFDIPDMRVEFTDATNNGVPVLKATPKTTFPTLTGEDMNTVTNSGATSQLANTANGTSTAKSTNDTLQQLVSSGTTFNNCTFVFNNK